MDMNTLAASLCGFKPSAVRDMPTAPKVSLVTPKRVYQGETITVSFLGFDLIAELDSDGTIEGIVSPDGSDCYCAFQDWAIEDIDKLVDKAIKQAKFDAQYDKGEERYNNRFAA